MNNAKFMSNKTKDIQYCGGSTCADPFFLSCALNSENFDFADVFTAFAFRTFFYNMTNYLWWVKCHNLQNATRMDHTRYIAEC